MGGNPSVSYNTANNRQNGFSYDAAGNVTGDGLHSYSYNALNQRVRTMVGGQGTEFVFGLNGQRASSWNGSGAEVEEKAYWGSLPLAVSLGGVLYYEHGDWLGTERLRTTASGGKAGSYTSGPFGDSLAVSGVDGDPFHFTTLDHDGESGLDHAQYREYSDAQGHWMSPDPYSGSYDWSNPESFNRYVYAGNNPLSFIDPSGLATCGTDPSNGIIECTSSYSSGDGGGDPSDLVNALVDIGEWFAGLFSGGPSFHGSLKPRPDAPGTPSCSTVLPNGNTLGQYINQGRAQLQAVVDAQNDLVAAGGDVNPFAVQSAFASFVRDYGPIDFKNGAAGNSVLANRATLGQAGNFAYYAIGSGYLSPTTLDVGASLYSHASVLLGKKSLSSLTGPLGIDASAASVRNAALATPGCPQ